MIDEGNCEVVIRGGFSDRNGLASINKEMQIDSLDNRSRIALYNCINSMFYAIQENVERTIGYFPCRSKINTMWSNMFSFAYNMPVNYSREYCDADVLSIILKTFEKGTFQSVMDLTEYLAQVFSDLNGDGNNVTQVLNCTLEKEFIGYRFVDKMLVPITNRQEIESIKKATDTDNNEVNLHFEKALVLLSDREKPDYENSIKESILAVERICSEVCGKKAILSDALKLLEDNGCKIHKALADAFQKLYGYTNDENGIRHDCGIGDNKSTFEEAEYMLVTCSAFVNYIITIRGKLSL